MAFNQVADIMRALGQNPTNKDVTKILGNPTADGKSRPSAFQKSGKSVSRLAPRQRDGVMMSPHSTHFL